MRANTKAIAYNEAMRRHPMCMALLGIYALLGGVAVILALTQILGVIAIATAIMVLVASFPVPVAVAGYLLTVRNGRIVAAQNYCPSPET